MFTSTKQKCARTSRHMASANTVTNVLLPMVDHSWWSKLMSLLNIKPRNAKSMHRLATAHTVWDASSSMALRTSLVSKSHQPLSQLSLRKTRVKSSTCCSRLHHLPKTKRLFVKTMHPLMETACFLKRAFSTSLTLHQTNKLWSLGARKTRNKGTPRYKFNRNEELLTVRCLSTASM